FSNRIRFAHAVNAPENPALAVVGNDRCGFRVILSEPLGDCLDGVVLALDYLEAGRRWIELDVVDPPGLRIAAPAGDAIDDQLIRDLEQQHDVERDAGLAERGVERRGLRARAREAIEHEPRSAVRLRQPLEHDRYSHFIGYEAAEFHVAIELEPELGALLDFG